MIYLFNIYVATYFYDDGYITYYKKDNCYRWKWDFNFSNYLLNRAVKVPNFEYELSEKLVYINPNDYININHINTNGIDDWLFNALSIHINKIIFDNL